MVGSGALCTIGAHAMQHTKVEHCAFHHGIAFRSRLFFWFSWSSAQQIALGVFNNQAEKGQRVSKMSFFFHRGIGGSKLNKVWSMQLLNAPLVTTHNLFFDTPLSLLGNSFTSIRRQISRNFDPSLLPSYRRLLRTAP